GVARLPLSPDRAEPSRRAQAARRIGPPGGGASGPGDRELARHGRPRARHDVPALGGRRLDPRSDDPRRETRGAARRGLAVPLPPLARRCHSPGMTKRPLLLLVPLALAALGLRPCPPTPDCHFGAGALPIDTLPAGSPHGAAIPIDHIVVLMQENRSFDHYFDQLFRENAPPERRLAPLPPNPDPLGGPP